jgi:tetratricopeptide (TPR) repeat protein
MSSPVYRFVIAALAACALPSAVPAAPFVPSSDQQVLERLPARAADPRQRELRVLREQWRAAPNDPGVAVRLARRYVEEAGAEGDPRYVGYAQAALAPWWTQPEPPAEVRVLRAVLRQYGHEFDAALADLAAATAADPGNAEARSWQVAILLVQADYAAARQACERLAAWAEALVGAACRAQVDALTGRAGPAANGLRSALRAAPAADPALRLWALTRLAEIEMHRGRHAEAEAAFREALSLGLPDVYLESAYADFLLDRGRAAEVIERLQGKERSDLLLLRLAIAGKALTSPKAVEWRQALAARFDAARLRGDALHQKEEARFALAVLGDTKRALELARSNYTLQREPADARVLLEAAAAASDPAAAEPVQRWLELNRVESVVLRELAARLKGRS